MRNVLFFVLVIFSISCQKKPFDLSTLKLGNSAKEHDFDNNGYFKKVPSSNEIIKTYSSIDNKSFEYNGIPIDSSNITFVTISNNEVVSLQTSVKKEKTLELAKLLIEKLGKPTLILTDRQSLNLSLKQKVFDEFVKVFPNETKIDEGSLNSIYYPYLLFWNDGKIYHVLNINLGFEGDMRNQYYPVTIKAFRANEVFGYKHPQPIDSPLYGYLK